MNHAEARRDGGAEEAGEEAQKNMEGKERKEKPTRRGGGAEKWEEMVKFWAVAQILSRWG